MSDAPDEAAPAASAPVSGASPEPTPIAPAAASPPAASDARAEADLLAANAVDCLPEGGLAAKLALAREQDRPLLVKLGIDPTAPDIHLGHAVVLRKLRQFQDAGHRVVLIVGDYTARVGDPSGRSSLRPMLDAQRIDINAATFQEQALKILDASPELLDVRRNGEWLDMPMDELLMLARTTTVAQLLERDDFAKRWSAFEPISMLELMYPLLQGYDSVAIRSDVEIGGTDQKFNLLLARDIQRAYGQNEQAILTMPILVGVDGRQKMSKSLGNHIAVADPPEEMYGKTMSIPDDAMLDYYRLLLSREPDPSLSARDAKHALAREIVSWLHGAQAASQAQSHFERVIVERRQPSEMEEIVLSEIEQIAPDVKTADGMVHLPALIAHALRLSRSQSRRLIDQGAVSLDGRQLAPGEYDAALDRLDGAVLRVGKRRFRRLRSA